MANERPEATGGSESEVSFAEVAAEDPADSVAHEAEIVEAHTETAEPGSESGLRAGADDPAEIGQPTLGSIMGGGAVPGAEESLG